MAAELPCAVISGVVSKATESAYDFIRRQISFVFTYQRYVEDLKNQVEELSFARQRVDVSVEDAKRQGEVIFKDVEQWLISVDNFMKVTAKRIIQDEDNAKMWCFKGLSPNLIKRYRLGKEALKVKNDGDNLLNRSKNFSAVSYCPILQKTESMYVRGYEAFESRMSKFQDIMEALKDANINLIGVYGMGGVGKTTLIGKVAWQAMEDKLFDVVVMAEVTQTPDYQKIQEKIAHDLGLEFDKETEVQRVGRIRDKLKTDKSVLVILDNIWEEFNLRAAGIPFGHDEVKSTKQMEDREERKDQMHWKILMTSRNPTLLRKNMCTQKNFFVGPLSYEEAKNLFGNIVGNLVEKPGYQGVAAQIISKCAGLPLAVTLIAKTLKQEAVHMWKDTLNYLEGSGSRHIKELDPTLFSTIEWSYKFLKREEDKKIFLLCSLFNAGYEINIYNLLRDVIGLGLFSVGTLEQKRNSLYTSIDRLKASSLLLEGNTKDKVKMHDIIHAVAVSIASTDDHMSNIQDVANLKQMLEDDISKDSIAISLPFKGIKELPERLKFLKLELFLLYEQDHSLQIPDLFFEETKQLKVLNFRGIYIPSLPLSFLYLTNLRTLSLEDCRLGDIAMIGELKRLESLSFSNSNIKQLPREIGQLTRLKILDLSNCFRLEVIAPNVISQFSQLEELYMGDSFVEWEAKGLNDQGRRNASLIELKELSCLTTLHIHIPDAQIMPQDLNFEKLERYKIFIGDVWNWSGNYETSRTLKLKLNSNISPRYNISSLLKRAEDLYLDELNDVQNVLFGLDSEGFPQLKHLHVQTGSKFSHIIHSQRSAPCNVFPTLESLYLHNLINLEKICHCQLPAESFSNLRIVNVVECDRLKHLFSFSLAKNLSQLQKIKVKDCENLTEIFNEEREDHVIQNEGNSKVDFSQLRSLTLQSLPQLKGFVLDMNSSSRPQTLVASNMGSTEIISEDESPDFVALFNAKVVFSRLEKLKLSSISIGKIWPNELPAMPSYSQTLMTITVVECNDLKILFSSSMVKSLVQLQILEIDNCLSMEEIIESEGLRGEDKIIKFPKLSKLVLGRLPKLTRFGTGDSIEFPSLKELEIYSCHNLETFLFSSSCAKMVSKEPEPMKWGNCSANICHLFDEKTGFPNLEALKINRVHNMSRIWHEKQSSDSFKKLRDLRVTYCNNLLSIVPSNMLGRLQGLETLYVSECDSMEVIFELQVLGEEIPTQLRELYFSVLPNLKYIWDMNIRGGQAFQNLVSIHVIIYERLKSLFPTSIARSLHQLEVLDVRDCRVLEEIVAKVGEIEAVTRFVFPKLTSLRLSEVSSLKTFFPETHIIEWPVLKNLKVMACAGKKIFASEFLSLQETQGESQHDISIQQPLFSVDKDTFSSLEELYLNWLCELLYLWKGYSHLRNSFQNLVSLEVSNCSRLRYLVTYSTAKNLVQLQRMTITWCEMIETIISHCEDEEKDQIAFKGLKYLKLDHLRSLKSFCSEKYTLEFPSLELVLVKGCWKMETFSQGVLDTPKLQKVQVTDYDDDYYFEEEWVCRDEEVYWEGDLNSTIKQLHK